MARTTRGGTRLTQALAAAAMTLPVAGSALPAPRARPLLGGVGAMEGVG